MMNVTQTNSLWITTSEIVITWRRFSKYPIAIFKQPMTQSADSMVYVLFMTMTPGDLQHLRAQNLTHYSVSEFRL